MENDSAQLYKYWYQISETPTVPTQISYSLYTGCYFLIHIKSWKSVLLQIRRDQFKPRLNKTYRQLKTGVFTDSKLLFGNDIVTPVTTISNSNKITGQMKPFKPQPNATTRTKQKAPPTSQKNVPFMRSRTLTGGTYPRITNITNKQRILKNSTAYCYA